MTKRSVYYLYLKDFPKVLVAVIEGELFLSLHEVLKRFKLKHDDPKVKDLVVTERITVNIDGHDKRIDIIDFEVFKNLSELDRSGEGFKFFTQVMKHKFDREHNIDNLTPNDLESMKTGNASLKNVIYLNQRLRFLKLKREPMSPT